MTTEAGGPVESVTVTEHQTGHDPRSCEACIRAREEQVLLSKGDFEAFERSLSGPPRDLSRLRALLEEEEAEMRADMEPDRP